jgi:hypothetical protein
MRSKTIRAVAARSADALRAAAFALSLCCALAACDRASAPEPPVATPAPTPVVAPPAATPAELMAVPETSVPVPAAGSVLALVYGASAGADEGILSDGRKIGFWRGYAYRTAGQDRYTAFVHAVALASGDMPQPAQQAELAQITYTLRDGAWQPGAPQTGVGRFGGMGRAPNVDADRVELTYTVAPDKALLALPSAMTATGGVRVRAYELLLFTAADGAWRHVGSVRTGVDHSAGCREGAATPEAACVRNSGSLRFDTPDTGAMPEIAVNFSGSTRGDDGAVRPAGPADSRTYRYDEAAASYVDTLAP